MIEHYSIDDWAESKRNAYRQAMTGDDQRARGEDPDGPRVGLPVRMPVQRVPPQFPLTAYIALVR